ncbi:MAG TPA: enoyl-CoA hydratase [Bacteroidetes bacterium]|nr:enoyl-CoA hydratase [Bacteroidota bacterium]
MAYNNITSNLENNILTIYIDRPEKLNALNKETLDELSDLLIKTKEDNEAMVLVITGSGNKSFVAGADISEFAHYNHDEGKALSAEGHDKVFSFIENYPKPVIAAINGFALGGGLELAMACHIRLASLNAKMGLPEVSLGVIPGYGGTQRLTQLVGKGKAMEMIMTTNMLTAEEGLSFGLVNQICEQDVLLETTYKLAGRILKNSPHAISCAIKAVNALYKDGEDGLKREIEEFGNCFGTPEFIEGTSAFMEKRKADFKSVCS